MKIAKFILKECQLTRLFGRSYDDLYIGVTAVGQRVYDLQVAFYEERCIMTYLHRTMTTMMSIISNSNSNTKPAMMPARAPVSTMY